MQFNMPIFTQHLNILCRYVLYARTLLSEKANRKNYSEYAVLNSIDYFFLVMLFHDSSANYLLISHCRFLVPGNTQKILRRFDTIFGLKMMVKSGLEKNILKFHDGLKSCCCPLQKILPRKAG